jgi:hypothetical protein
MSGVVITNFGALALAVLTAAWSFGVGLIFLGAALAHVRHRGLLVGVVGNYRLLPLPLVKPVAVMLPMVELALGLALVTAPFARASALAGLAAAALLGLFGAAMGINLRRGRGMIDCGCGHAALRQTLHRALVVRNLVLALPLLATPFASVPLAGFDLVSALAGGFALCLGYHVCNALVALLTSPLAPSYLPVRR